MTIHLNANPGDIAEIVLLLGDPMRAKFVFFIEKESSTLVTLLATLKFSKTQQA